MSDIVIFTMSTGGGHNEAARNLKNKYIEKGYKVSVVDAMEVVNPKMGDLVIDSYIGMASKIPGAYGALYKTSNTKNVSKLVLKSLQAVSSKKILKIIKDENPNLIISTHPFVVSFVAALKEDGLIDIPFISVVTDFEAHRVYVSQYVDAYIVASDFTRDKLIEDGINPKIIHPYGIPIDPKFFKKTDIVKDKSNFNILLMAGALGFKFMEEIVETLVTIDYNLKIRAICGNNKEIQDNLNSTYKYFIDKGVLEVYGFVHNVDEFMDMSDCIITKPGGLTTTEAICKRIPMVIPYYLPGQEKENTDYLTFNDMAILVRSNEDLKKIIEKLITHPRALKYISENMDDLAKTYSIDKVVDLGIKFMEE